MIEGTRAMWTIPCQENLLVSRHRGALPVLLTCPHGGAKQPPGMKPREKSAPGCGPINALADTFTREIITGIAQLILETLGESPYVVIAEFHRKYIDANRPLTCATDQQALGAPFYREYHQTIRAFMDEIRAENGPTGFLFDIHGTKTIEEDPADVYLGTDNGKSVKRLLDADPDAVWKRRSLRGLLQAAGYVVSPATKGIEETPQVNGGFTTETYGSSHADGLDAIQIEIAQPIRQNATRRNLFIEHLGRAIASITARSF
jgi:N-formylglutamate amidohydrolase